MNEIKAIRLSAELSGKKILDSITFSAKQGEFVSIVGKSGCGKTTFLNCLAGFIPFKGEAIVPKNAGFVFQNNSLFPWLTAGENIVFGLADKNDLEKQKIAGHYLKIIGLGERARQYPHQLSLGEAQRVAISRSFAPSPSVVLMDEPFASLDVHTRDKMQKWLMSLCEQEKKTIVFVTHYIDEAIFLSDKIAVMKGGGFAKVFKVPFSRPREEEIKFTEKFTKLKRQITNSIN